MSKVSFVVVLCLSLVGSLFAGQHEGGYDHDLAVHLLYFSGIVQCGIDMLQSWKCPDCFPDVHKRLVYESDAIAQTQVLITDNRKDEIVVAFRGTEYNLWQWINNADVEPVAFHPEVCPDCKVHGGLYDRFLDVRDLVMAELQKAATEFPEADIYFTGHSAGGVWAIMLAAHIAVVNPALMPTGVYTFGTPRIANAAFAKFFSPILADIYVRVIRPQDPMPYMPAKKSTFSETIGTIKALLKKSKTTDPSFYHHFGVLAVCPAKDGDCKVYPRDTQNPLKHMPKEVSQHSNYLGYEFQVRYGPGKSACGGKKKSWAHRLGVDYMTESAKEKLSDTYDSAKDGVKSAWNTVTDLF
eukprot:TRINITY_DN75_c0_g1_i1.p1 TRINITY_DN75_c0_g1~~TRINITY_DN75_c0_g1_i1.p1  ORF type:complete len:354 (-),score=129.72 TRINITY_DN75_c0_g1_i1:92-1153(-)